MMQILKLLGSKQWVGLLIAVALFFGGGVSLYYLKYRPVRNEVISLRAENGVLANDLAIERKRKDVIVKMYSDLAKIPRYQIDQHLDRIKVKRGSSFDFSPDAIMVIEDSVKSLQDGDSITLIMPNDSLKERTKVGKIFEAIGNLFRGKK